jgi:TetR/AcrR family transcriptional regulator, transcriptional repressor for nem operon
MAGTHKTPALRKGARTRRMIVERSAPVFNVRGFAGASMSELVEATGFEKGGIYNHFGSKEALALEAFDYSVSLLVERFGAARASRVHAADQLVAIVEAFAGLVERPPLPGGCPVMNTALDSDDTQPALAEHARDAMISWHRLIGSIVKAGKERGELRADTDPYVLATLLTATLEGALALSRLLDDPAHMGRAVDHVTKHIRGFRTDKDV